MATTERQSDPFWQTAVLADLQRFAALPGWLIDATRSASVASALAGIIPECRTGTLTIVACKIGGLRLSAAWPVWTGTYQVTVEMPATSQRQVLALQGTLFPPDQPMPPVAATPVAFGQVGWGCAVPDLHLELAVPPPEPLLPVLPQLTDPAEARTLLERSLRASDPAYHDAQIQSCQPEVLRHHPGLRATVRYHLTYPTDAPNDARWPDILIAKTYEGEQGRHAYDGMRALWHSSLATSERVRIAEPIAYLPDSKLLIQGPIPEEQTLTGLLEEALRTQAPDALADLDIALHKTAIALAGLHQAGIATSSAYGWNDELAEVRRFVERVAAVAPVLEGAATPLLATLDVYAAITTPDPAVFAHGTFRPNQVLLQAGRVGLIDFDSWCRAEPAVDLALFLTSVRDVGLSAIGTAGAVSTDLEDEADRSMAALTQLDAICDAFLAQYAALMPVTWARVALWEALYLFTLVLRSWERVKPVRLANSIRLLDRHIRRHLV